MLSDHALNGFLKQYLDDQSSGQRRSLVEYQALFPGQDAVIAARYADYESDDRDRANLERPDLPGRIGPYEILADLGRGGQGTVYLGTDERLHRRVAVKVLTGLGSLTKDSVARFMREAAVASRLCHPAIATVYEIGTDGGIPYIAMQYVEGETVARKIAVAKEDGAARTPPGEIVRVVEAVARALHAAHEAGVIHRDVKPGNILITASGDPVIVDFGLAHDADGDLAAITRTGEFFGTPAYMSPEQLTTEKSTPDRRTDVWSLGVTLFEWLTLRRPFEAPTRDGLYRAILTKSFPDAREIDHAVPHDLALVVATALEKDRDRRYRTALDFAEDLRRVRMREPILAKPVGKVVRMRRWGERNRALAAALAGLFVVLLAGLAIAVVLLGEKTAALEDYHRLGDLSRLQGLIAQADDLWPAIPDRVPAMKDWLARASELGGRLGHHVASLDRLRRSGSLVAPAPRASDAGSPDSQPTWKFGSSADQFKHDTTAKLVSSLAAFVDPKEGLMAGIRRRLSFAESIEHETTGKYASQWADAIQSISDRSACPAYGGLRVKPQIGLVPIGKDPHSGLWEFAHLETTSLEESAVPRRGPDGRLVVAEGTGLVLVLLPEGTFKMGAVRPDEDQAPTEPNLDPEANDVEAPPTEVSLDPFFMSKYEMTQGQWFRLTTGQPSLYPAGTRFGGRPVTFSNPVEQVSWDDCNLWLGRAQLLLPTEAQWEYAARGGTTTPRWTGLGHDGLSKAANVADLSFHALGGPLNQAYERWDDGYLGHAPVGSFAPNPFGLHDVLGNVAEWCRDAFGGYEAAPAPGDGLRHPATAHGRVFRGGSFRNDASFARSAFRLHDPPDLRSSTRGIRPARALDR